MALTLSDDVWVHIGLHLKPRHLSKLMRTCKRINRLVDNETYWTRVVGHLALRDSWILDLSPPCGESAISSVIGIADFPKLDPGLYFLVGLDQGYYLGLQQFFQGISNSIQWFSTSGDEDDRAWFVEKQGQTLQELILEYAVDKWRRPATDSMKDFAKDATIEFWVTDKTHLQGCWPGLQKFLIDLEDDPMPAVYKRRIFRKMFDSFGGSLQLWCGPSSSAFVVSDLCIF